MKTFFFDPWERVVIQAALSEPASKISATPPGRFSTKKLIKEQTGGKWRKPGPLTGSRGLGGGGPKRRY